MTKKNFLSAAPWSRRLRLCLVATGAWLRADRVHAQTKPMTLRDAIERVLQANADVTMAQAAEREQRIVHALAGVRSWMPKIYVSGAHRHVWTDEGRRSTAQADPILGVEWEMQALSDQLFDAAIRKKENGLYRLRTMQVKEAKVRETATAYYALALAQKKSEMAHTAVQIAASRLKVETQRFRLGLASKITYLQASIALKQAQFNCLQEQERLKAERRHFNALLHLPCNESTVVAAETKTSPISKQALDGLLRAKSQATNWDSAMRAQEAAIAQSRLAKAKWLPLSCLSLSGSCATEGYAHAWDTSKTERIGQNSFALGVSLRLDLGSLLRWPARVKVARLALERVEMAWEKQQNKLAGELEAQRWDYRQALEAHQIAVAQWKLTKEKLALVREQYRLHQIDLLKLQEAQEAVQKAELALLQALFHLRKTEFELAPLSLGP